MKRKLIFSILFTISIISFQIAYAEPEFSFEFGSSGSGDDNLDTPTDVIVSENGREIYVVDSENNRINVFDDDGDHDFEYGTFCDIAVIQDCNDNAVGADQDGDGQFDNPISIALDTPRKFFVADSDNKRIQVFDDYGKFQLKFGSSNSGNVGYIGSPEGITIQESSGKIFVSDAERDSISVFDSRGNFMFKFDLFDGNNKFDKPSNMIIDNSEEMLYVADTGKDRIVIFELIDDTTCPYGTKESVDGVCFVKEFGSAGDIEGEFDDPTGLAFDSTSDLLYVADRDNDRIQIFKMVSGDNCPSGTEEIVEGVCFVEEFGSPGDRDGEFDGPMGIALDATNDLLFVADSGNDRIQAFEIDTTSTGSSGGTLDAPKNLKASPVSIDSIIISWDEPEQEGSVSAVSGYKIEYKIASENYLIVTENTASTATSFIHQGLDAKETYSYRVYAINSDGTSSPSSSVSIKPAKTTTPAAVTATAISASQIRVSWLPPSETFGQSISGYEVKRLVIEGVYDVVGETNGGTHTFVVSNLITDKTYTYVVSAVIGYGTTQESNTASATPRKDSADTAKEPTAPITGVVGTISTPPIKLTASTVSATQINLAWSPPVDDGNSSITGYKIEAKKDNDSYATIVGDTKDTTTSYSHTGLATSSKYTYRVSAINSAGTSEPSNEVYATAKTTSIQINPMGKLTIDEGKMLSFIVKLTDSSIKDSVFSLEKNPPPGAKINSSTGMFSWTPSSSDGGKSYTFDLVVKKDGVSDRQSITIDVNDTVNDSQSPKESEPKQTAPEPKQTTEPRGLASFVDESRDPQSYVDRYNTEASYKKWFDDNYPEYSSIYEAVGLEEPNGKAKGLASFVDESRDPQSYVDRYNTEASYKKWFDDNYPEYSSIYEAVGLEEPKAEEKKVEEPKVEEKKFGICGPGTKLIEGVCTIVEKPQVKPWWQFW